MIALEIDRGPGPGPGPGKPRPFSPAPAPAPANRPCGRGWPGIFCIDIFQINILQYFIWNKIYKRLEEVNRRNKMF